MEAERGVGRHLNTKVIIRSWLLNTLFHRRVVRLKRRLSEWHRNLTGSPHVVSVFLELDDPYSYLLSYYLPELADHYDIELRLYLTEAIQGALRPAPDLYSEYAVRDCEQMARELGIPFLDKDSTPPVEYRRSLLETLAGHADGNSFDSELYQALALYWRGDFELVSRRVEGVEPGDRVRQMFERNQTLLKKMGHFNTAMIHYGGEWYWGVDRLHYLVTRLDSLGVLKSASAPKIASIRQVMQLALPVKPPATAAKLPPMELFHSFRSPYSYLCLKRIFQIADAFGIEVRVRPVLPMVMRGMQVPRSKLHYIMFDASREAQRSDIPFGNIADPVGVGVERCLAVFQYAKSEHRERDFVLSAGELIWSRAVDVATDAGLRKVTAKTGLFWPDAKSAIDDDGWRRIADDNRRSMMESGSWGVPTLRMGEFVTWGQDRDWLLVRHIEELCDTGDGILV